ncbi:hypothetical protein HPB50_001060 [Hyalomma asiaticum]|uniref:Uncharacterized protein n=1 Tax=Hyalomma asiaticum TaxID=266040 RepID=A0ACB7RP14_HYAAI|nr:hypothetical protein HPB50_001060 [Hyalomma asiaticum]
MIRSVTTTSIEGGPSRVHVSRGHLHCELIKYNGYPCEISYATTYDGYLLEVDHIPHCREGSLPTSYNRSTPRYPVLLLPVFTSASDMWFLNYPSQSPGKC